MKAACLMLLDSLLTVLRDIFVVVAGVLIAIRLITML